ncbi:hypothetical protein GJAV_G00088210 [Gymnothorax javanicus]|nr:hypothetical protein GJAV_G00088210 [Gymnothorax javanicus]
MAESETKCTAPGLNTLEPECVTANSRVCDLHHTEASLIKTEADLGSTDSGDLKTESPDSVEVAYVTHLHPDQIKTETDDRGYLKAEQISDWQDIKCDKAKYESNESMGIDLMKTEMSGVGLDHKEPADPRPSAVCLNVNCKEEIHDLSIQSGYLNPCRFVNNEKNGNGIIQESTKSINKHITCQSSSMTVEPIMFGSNKPPRILNFLQKKTVHVNKGEIQMVKRSFKCTVCEKSFNFQSGLSDHFRIHSGEKPFKCPQCEKCFRRQYCLNVHLRTHTGEKPYKCSHCGKCFSRLPDLKHHLRIHTGEKPYKCTECEKCFRWQACLNVHMRIHTGENSYKCTECGKDFCNLSFLESHLRIHTGEKPYKCGDCGKCFSDPSSFKRHLLIHTGEKPYRCTHCGKSFSTKFNLNSHHRIHTGEKPYKCSHCGKCFARLCNVNRHQRIHTDEKP